MTKNVKICIVCGKYFECPPSSKKITCSKECSRIRKAESHKGKSNQWNEESQKRLSKLGMTQNLRKGTEAAKTSPNSGRFETNVNAIDWHLISPEGKHYYFHSLNNWLRENGENLFGCKPDTKEYYNTRSGLTGAKRAMLGKKYGGYTYKGWQVLPTDDDMEI